MQVEFHECLSWALYGDEWSVSQRGHFTSQARGHVPTQQEAEWKRGKFLPVQKIDTRFCYGPACTLISVLKIFQLKYFIEIQ